MRLGQLARKYNVSQDEVILYLNEVQSELSPFHHNSKLSDEIEGLVTSRFSSSSEKIEEATEEHSDDIATETNEQILDVTEIDHNKETEADLQRELDASLPPIQISEPEPDKQNENAIDAERLLELLESDEESPDLSNITHIKAAKKELSGLKVVGRIELTEPKSKSAEKIENQEKEPSLERINRHERQRLSDEEKEKRRLKAKEKNEEYEARKEKRRIEKEKKQKKAQNKMRYEQKMQQIKASQPKQKIQEEAALPEVNLPPKPTSFLGKVWQWLKA